MTPQKHNQLPPKPREEGELNIDSYDVVSGILVPGLIGIIGTFVISRVVPIMFGAILSRHSIDKMLTDIGATMKQDINEILSFNWSHTNVWIVVVFGFLLGVFIKYSYGEEKIR